MSPHVGNFVTDLVEMAKAMETLPQVQAELDRAKADNESLHSAVQAREEAIARYKAEIDALNAKIRDTEAQRDDAEYRFLDLDDKASKVLGVLKSIVATANTAHDTLSPPKPQPEPTPEPTPEPVSVQPTPTPAPSITTGSTATTGGATPSNDAPSSDHTTALNPSTDEGQRVPSDPTVNSTAGDGASQSNATPIPSAAPSADAIGQAPVPTQPSGPTDDTAKPYAGKNWKDVHPRVWDQQQWLDGGGTVEGWHAS